jgi:hypothetical protein
MILGLGWPSVFYGFGSLGLVWFLFWQSKAASTPSADKAISKEERAYILVSTPQQSAAGRPTEIPWRLLLSRREVRSSPLIV